ncbi:sensor histidine kinase [Spirosoma sp.]|uniref:sensor histidine kinase n=1 Tax=Spirosoma sp. TaxID=1899569 RepID=UPI003B3BA392
MSKSLYWRLPDTLRPADRYHLTISEVQKINKHLFEVEGLSEENIDETDRLCHLFAPRYKEIADDRNRQDFLYFVCNYLYNSYATHTSNKTTLRGQNPVYESPHTQSGIRYCNLYLKEYSARPLRHPIWMGNVLMFKSHFQMEDNRYVEAYYTLQELRDITNSQDMLPTRVLAYNALSFMFESLSLADQALIYSDSSLATLSRASTNLAWVKAQTANTVQSRQNLFLEKYRATGQRQFIDSIYKIHDRLKSTIHKDTRLFVSTSYVNIAQYTYLQKQYESTLAHLDSAVSFYKDIANTAIGEQFIVMRGLSLLRLGREAEAMAVLRTLHFNVSTGFALLAALEKLYLYELRKGNNEQALHYQNLIMKFKDRRHKLEMQGKSLEMEQLYKAKARDNQIALLKQQQIRNGFLALFAIFGILLALLIMFARYRSGKRKIKELVQKVDEVMQMQLAQVEIARETERKVIGQQLHDDLSSSMAATLLYLRMRSADMTDSKEKEQAFAIANLLEESYIKTRGKSHELYLENDSSDFWLRLSQQIELLFSGTSISFDFNGDINGAILTPAMRSTLVMILREAIMNIIRHSRASKAQILLYYEQNFLVLEVSDNGRGFSVDGIQKNAGYKSLNERVTKLRGSIIFSSAYQSGTKIVVKIPV